MPFPGRLSFFKIYLLNGRMWVERPAEINRLRQDNRYWKFPFGLLIK